MYYLRKSEGCFYTDVWKVWKQLSQFDFHWGNLSRTPHTPSRYPVNASGTFTVFQDDPYAPINGPEIYYKINPDDIPVNISQTIASSFYPQATARFIRTTAYLYTAWLDGDGPAYEIRFKKLQYDPTHIPTYLTADNGYETPSPYLVARDNFISTWQIPVDIGYQTITYRFPLEPNYRYKIKAVAYHQSTGQWREWIKIDNKLKHLIKYNAYKPETLEFWIPPAYYKDGVIEVVFERITGSFATAGPIYIYQYEYEEGEIAGGPMAQEGYSAGKTSFSVTPNPFTERTVLRYQTSDNSQRIALKIYDATGRMVKQFNGLSGGYVIWNGDDDYSCKVAQGIYFLKLENFDTGASSIYKVLKIK